MIDQLHNNSTEKAGFKEIVGKALFRGLINIQRLKKVQEEKAHYLRPMVTAEIQLCMYHHCKGKILNTENGPS